MCRPVLEDYWLVEHWFTCWRQDNCLHGLSFLQRYKWFSGILCCPSESADPPALCPHDNTKTRPLHQDRHAVFTVTCEGVPEIQDLTAPLIYLVGKARRGGDCAHRKEIDTVRVRERRNPSS